VEEPWADVALAAARRRRGRPRGVRWSDRHARNRRRHRDVEQLADVVDQLVGHDVFADQLVEHGRLELVGGARRLRVWSKYVRQLRHRTVKGSKESS
jgi:hypothetical protein